MESDDCGGGESVGNGEILTSEQFKEKKKFYPWLTMTKLGLGCAMEWN